MTLTLFEVQQHLGLLIQYHALCEAYDQSIQDDLYNMHNLLSNLSGRNRTKCLCMIFPPIKIESIMVAYYRIPGSCQRQVLPLIECIRCRSCSYLLILN